MPGGRKKREASVEFWIEAVRGASTAGAEVAREAAVKWRRALRDVEEGLSRLLPAPSLEDLLAYPGTPVSRGARRGLGPVYGVDSSRTKPVRVGFRLVSFISAAAVRLPPRDSQDEARVEFMRVSPKIVPEDAPPEKALLEITLEMFRLEAEALHEASKEGVPVYLDGPIVDPPSLSRSVSGGLEEKYRRYVERRAEAAARLGGSIVGFVKRLTGRMYADMLFEETGWEWLREVNDYFLAQAYAHQVAGILRGMGECRGDRVAAIVTKPYPLPAERAPDVRVYEEAMGGWRVYHALTVPGACSGNMRKPARIEFLVPPGGDPSEAALEAAAMVEARLVEGAWMPEPVLLAHKACTIRRRESLKLLREAATRYARKTVESEGRPPPGFEWLLD